MKLTVSKALALLSATAATASALAEVSIDFYLNNNTCSSAKATTYTLLEGACLGIEGWPWQSLAPYLSNSACSDANKSPVLYTWTTYNEQDYDNCGADLYATYDVTDEAICYAVDAEYLQRLQVKCE
ncbi:uncharacterized protein BO97DRAFT_440379 [Aspergillus homomorphus CBS 101889]|uniref:Uncharacterized protein n=1 Tax=Aspergillus homomorphus (strain CBS 101889) TaxID=1450537 RepID=A0A395I7D7_ASPHC|nr:hypothetical protein BO97DRAFT_440379 [Aspergillus homomorphus CBS 101889]RAL15719.1 hypothetical protein BO97DRAFT_440379 [Aspergillus homomorphus CBS 101889]